MPERGITDSGSDAPVRNSGIRDPGSGIPESNPDFAVSATPTPNLRFHGMYWPPLTSMTCPVT